MLNSIKDFLLKDHAPTQYFLYSVPVVNVLVRKFQSYHSLDNAADGQNFRMKERNFKSHINTVILMQLALTVSTLVLCILLPPATTIQWRINSICAIFLALCMSNKLGDSIWRSEMFAPTNGPLNVTGW